VWRAQSPSRSGTRYGSFRDLLPNRVATGDTDRERRPFRGLHTYQQLSHLDGDFDWELQLKDNGEIMRNFLRLLLLATSAVYGFGESATQPFVITISSDSQAVGAGSDVAITVRLKNTSNRELDLSANISSLTGVDPNYIYDVRDGSGSSVPRKVYEHPELATGHVVFRTVKPGESMSETEPIGRLFDLSKRGKYTIQVSRRVSEHEKDGVVKSNAITVTVAGPPLRSL
jgi:hypothetical protein